MNLEFKVTCDVAFTSGKFAGKEDIESEIQQALEGAEPGSMTIGEGEYDVGDWTVQPVYQPTPRAIRHLARVEAAHRDLYDALRHSIQQTAHQLPPTIVKAFNRLERLTTPRKEKSHESVPADVG